MAPLSDKFPVTILFLLIFCLAAGQPLAASANDDVYSALPDDIEVIQFMTGDIDGDSVNELGIMYTWRRSPRLSIFRGDSGRWQRWFEVDGTFIHRDGLDVRSFELADATGDGVAELLLYHVDRRRGGMLTTVLTWTASEPDPGFNPVLEDRTVPAGYPLLGREEDRPAITFLNMGNGDGYRRVYCWNGDKFEKCKEVVWRKP
jgi:hypothetical protein